MTKRDDGGPAFPYAAEWGYQEGMTLRDWFAGQVLQGLVSDSNNLGAMKKAAIGDGLDLSEYLSSAAYEQADAMLKERNK